MAKLDLIDRTALVEELEGLKAILGDVFLGMVVERAIERVKAQPVLEVQPGSWIAVPSSDMMTGKAYKCSKCGKMRYGSYMPNYCQCCGTKMDGVSNA